MASIMKIEWDYTQGEIEATKFKIYRDGTELAQIDTATDDDGNFITHYSYEDDVTSIVDDASVPTDFLATYKVRAVDSDGNLSLDVTRRETNFFTHIIPHLDNNDDSFKVSGSISGDYLDTNIDNLYSLFNLDTNDSVTYTSAGISGTYSYEIIINIDLEEARDIYAWGYNIFGSSTEFDDIKLEAWTEDDESDIVVLGDTTVVTNIDNYNETILFDEKKSYRYFRFTFNGNYYNDKNITQYFNNVSLKLLGKDIIELS